MNKVAVKPFFKTIAAMLAMACAVLFVSACGGGGGGAPAGGGSPQPQFRTQNIAPERLQLDGIRAQYPGLVALGIDHAVVSDSPDFPDHPPNGDAQRLGEYALENGGRAVVWLVPENGAQARAVDTPEGRFLVYARMYVPARLWNSVASAENAPFMLSPPVAVRECVAGLALENGVCVPACEGGEVDDNYACQCPRHYTLVDGSCELICYEEKTYGPQHEFHANCTCPSGTRKFKIHRNFPSDNFVCQKPQQCAEGLFVGEYNECRLPCSEDLGEEECERHRWEYESSPASHVTGMLYARDLGLTGKGVTIGSVDNESPYWRDDCEFGTKANKGFVVYVRPSDRHPSSRPDDEIPARYANYENGECDEGLVRTHSDFPSIRVEGDAPPKASSAMLRLPHRDSAAHAIAVLGVMAAQNNNYGVVGIAPDADYHYGLYNHDWNNSPDVEIVNHSIGGDRLISHYAGAADAREQLTSWLSDVRQLLSHVSVVSNPADRRIHVFAGGNSGSSELEATAGFPIYFPELRGNVLAAVAAGANGEIASYSNRCGSAGSSFCLAAPVGGWVQGPDVNEDQFFQATGTSVAAPLVSGALALVKEYFNHMGGIGSHELVRRILQTADKSGRYADESIYGAGLLDLGNALTPQGELQLLSGRSVSDSESHSLSGSGLRTGAAFGDSIGKSLGDVQIAAFDKLNAPFPVAAAGLVQSEWESESLRDALLALQFEKPSSSSQTQWDFANGFGWWSLRGANSAGQPEIESIFGADDAYANPYSALAGDGMSGGLEWDSFRMEMFGESPGQETLARGAVGSFSFAPFSETMENGGWILHFGGVDELNGFLSSSGTGAFGDLRSRTAFVGADYVGEKINGWRIRLGGFAGDTSAENGEWFAGTESLRSDSFHLGVERENIFYSGDGLGFRLHQPLRASGSLKIRIPTGRTRYGDLTWREVSGKTSGRELALEGLYRRSFEGGSWRVSAGAVSEPGHRAEAKTIGRMLFAFEREF